MGEKIVISIFAILNLPAMPLFSTDNRIIGIVLRTAFICTGVFFLLLCTSSHARGQSQNRPEPPSNIRLEHIKEGPEKGNVLIRWDGGNYNAKYFIRVYRGNSNEPIQDHTVVVGDRNYYVDSRGIQSGETYRYRLQANNRETNSESPKSIVKSVEVKSSSSSQFYSLSELKGISEELMNRTDREMQCNIEADLSAVTEWAQQSDGYSECADAESKVEFCNCVQQSEWEENTFASDAVKILASNNEGMAYVERDGTRGLRMSSTTENPESELDISISPGSLTEITSNTEGIEYVEDGSRGLKMSSTTIDIGNPISVNAMFWALVTSKLESEEDLNNVGDISRSQLGQIISQANEEGRIYRDDVEHPGGNFGSLNPGSTFQECVPSAREKDKCREGAVPTACNLPSSGLRGRSPSLLSATAALANEAILTAVKTVAEFSDCSADPSEIGSGPAVELPECLSLSDDNGFGHNAPWDCQLDKPQFVDCACERDELFFPPRPDVNASLTNNGYEKEAILRISGHPMIDYVHIQKKESQSDEWRSVSTRSGVALLGEVGPPKRVKTFRDEEITEGETVYYKLRSLSEKDRIESVVAGDAKIVTFSESETGNGAQVSIPSEIEIGKEVSFEIEGLDPKNSYEWDIYDPRGEKIEKRGDGLSLSFTPSRVGEYRISSIRVNDPNDPPKNLQPSRTFRVSPSSSALLATIDAPNLVEEGENITFDVAGSRSLNGSIERYQWVVRRSIDDQVVDKGTGRKWEWETSFDGAGNYSITLVVHGDNGQKDSSTRSFYVVASRLLFNWDTMNVSPDAQISGPSEVSKNRTIRFDGHSSEDSDGSVTEYEWTVVGPGGFSEFGVLPDKYFSGDGPVFEKAFSETGRYKVFLVVTDNDGETSTDLEEFTVKPF